MVTDRFQPGWRLGAQPAQAVFFMKTLIFGFADRVVGQQVYLADIGQPVQKGTDPGEILFRVADAGYQGNADKDGRAEFVQPAQVVMYQPVADVGIAAMEAVIDQFEIEEEEVGIGINLLKVSPGGMAGRIDRAVDFPFAAAAQQVRQEIGLQQRFAPGEGDAPAGFIIKREIFRSRRLSRRR